MFDLSPSTQTDSFKERNVLFPILSADFLTRPVSLGSAEQTDFSLLNQLAVESNWVWNKQLVRSLLRNQHRTIVVTDPARVIQYVSSGFEKMTGYSSKFAVGKRPDFLQGTRTDMSMKQKLRTQFSAKETVKVDLVNYKKSGEEYICRVEIEPICDTSGELKHFLAIEWDITATAF